MNIKSDEEYFKDIPGYEGKYKISNLGNVWSIGRYVDSGNGRMYISSRELKKNKRNK